MRALWAACGAAEARVRGVSTACVLLLATLLRLYVGTQPHSGQATPPKFGDYEELTLHTPLREWYVETPRNNLSYWGLDYPPASGYQSWLCGRAVAALEPAAVALGSSHGYESASSKRLLRATVLAFDAAVLFPAVLLALRALRPRAAPSDAAWALAAVVLQPAFILIDHGHFQYNNISLGLTAAAVAAILRGHHALGSVLYTCAFNHKQMALFYAPAFFAHLLGRCLASPRPVARVARLGVAVIGTMLALWGPFLRDPGALAVALRLAPIKRGVYEDHVASLWCVTNPLFRWKTRFEAPALARAAATLSLAACVPCCAQQLLRPSRRGLLYAMLNTALAAFLLGFQVHEKSILLPLLPAALLAHDEPVLIRVLGALAAFSMFPLLRFERLGAAYAATLAAAAAALWQGPPETAESAAGRPAATRAQPAAGQPGWLPAALFGAWPAVAVAGAAALHAAYAVPAPAALPHLHALGVSAFSAANFAAAAAYANWRQWQLPADEPERAKAA